MKNCKILVAEDDLALSRSVGIRLRSQGYEVACAEDGSSAVKLAARQLPDLMILDIHMPRGDGFSVQDRVRGMAGLEHLPIVFVSGDHSHQRLSSIHNPGGRWFLRKPFDTDELLGVVRQALRDDDDATLVGESEEHGERFE